MKTKIDQDLKTAIKAQDQQKLLVLRSVKAGIINAEKEKGKDLSDMDIVSIIRKELKKRQDAAQAYLEAERFASYNSENNEAKILEEYLPTQLTDEQVDDMVQEAIENLGATSKKDTGKVIAAVVLLANGGTDNKTISQKVGKLLN